MILNLPELLKNQPKRKINLNFKPNKTSLHTELWYRNALLALVRNFRQVVESEGFFANEVNLNDSQFTDANKDFDADRFLKAAEKLGKADIDGVAKKIAQGLLIRGNTQNIQEVSKDLKRQTGVDLQGYLYNSGKVAEKLEQLTTANVLLIKSIPSQYLDKIQATVMQAQVKGTLTKDLAKQIKEIGGVTEKRAKLIARDQSAKINATLTRARHEEMGVTQYIWSTSGDERVRDSHAENDGKVFSYDNPPPTGNPGDEINCRCIAVPVLVETQLPADNPQTQESSASENEKIDDIPQPEIFVEANTGYLPSPSKINDVVKIGEEISRKYKKELDKTAKNPDSGSETILQILRKEGVEFGSTGNYVSDQEKVAKMFESATSRYPSSWINKDKKYGKTFLNHGSGRGFHFNVKDLTDDQIKVVIKFNAPEFTRFIGKKISQRDSFIHIDKTSNPMAIMIHEFGHRLQSSIPKLDEYFTALWVKRTKGDKVEKLKDVTGRAYGNDEITKKDEFPDPYFGKIYRENGQDKPKEMLTMIFQALLGDDPEMYEKVYKDKELFNLGLALLARYKP